MSRWVWWAVSLLVLAILNFSLSPRAASANPSSRISMRSHQRKAAWPVCNIKDFGAKCDGRTDDSSAIRAAIQAANENGLVYIPAGTCVFSAPISAGKVQIRGVGKNVSILKYKGASGSAFTFDYPIPMYMLSPGMSDLSLIGPGPETNTTGVLLGGKAGAEGARFDSVEIADFGTGITNSKWVFLTEFKDCYLSNGVDAKLNGSPTSGENMRFVHCTFDHTTKPSSVIVDGGDYMQPEFVDCSFDGAVLRIQSGMVSVVGGHFEDTCPGGKYFAIIGDGRHDATVSIVNATLNADGHYSYPSKSLFHVRSGSNLNVEDLQACTLIHAFNVMDVDAGGKGSIINLMVPNCGGWANSPLAATGEGSANVEQIATPGSGTEVNNVITRPIQFGKDGPAISWGAGAPGGSCANGSLYLNKSGKSGSTLYVCVTGNWAAAK
ncbi:MAG: hypothetical protein KGM47_13520 [Acidobacteriota bacterium]|nr:hypothetical protein [Acidobacteriota bacterium]